jgi:diguanylate cyclase (GGDEF)-like protein
MEHHSANGDEGVDRAEHRAGGAQAADNAEESLTLQDQTLADNDQTLSERDQTQSDRDQQASEDDQHAADFDRDHGGDPEAYRLTTAARVETTSERANTSYLRDRTAQERDLAAERRDVLATERDRAFRAADKEAAHVESKEEVAERHALNLQTLRASGRAARLRAAHARESAARDRAQAARDRQQAAEDRERAYTDELTGARRRGVGLEELEHEMQRARREARPLVAVHVDVDGLKAVNDELGHAAGDELLASVAEGLRHHMRPYNLLVRVGGDEFLCALSVSKDEARRRFEDLRVDLEGWGQSVSVGFSELHEGDSADELLGRADKDLLARRV